TVAWHCEFDAAPSKILAHHWPEVPNLGDITTADWSQVEPVDVITGGFPCQDVSHAGRRQGLIRDGEGRTRSGLWGHMLRAIDTLRPDRKSTRLNSTTLFRSVEDPRPPLARGPQPRRHYSRRLVPGRARRRYHRRVPLPGRIPRRATPGTHP